MRGHVETVLKRGDGNLQCKELWYCDSWHFVDVAYPSKDIVFRFVIEYSSRLRDFGPLCNRCIFI
jgi:hypothetical protein